MNRIPLTLAILILLIASRSLAFVTIQAGDTVHCSADALVATGPLDADCVAFTPTPTLTATATSTSAPTATDTPTLVPTATDTATPTAMATQTLVPTLTATWTPMPTSTFTPIPTATLGGVWPKCATHDPTVFHGDMDFTRGCVYDHTHNANLNSDPALVAIFGPWASEWGGTPAVGFPWSSGPTEKTTKHAGFKGMQRNAMPCNATVNQLDTVPANCVVAYEIEYHALANVLDANANFHSYFQRIYACSRINTSVCGTAAGGGLIDAGVLLLPYPNGRVPRPAGCYDFGLGSAFGASGNELSGCFAGDPAYLNTYRIPNDPYWSHSILNGTAGGSNWYVSQNYRDSLIFSLSGTHWDGPGFANTHNNPYFSFDANAYDPWDILPPSNPLAPAFVCSRNPSFVATPGQPIPNRCPYNGTMHSISQIGVRTIDMLTRQVLPELVPYVNTTPQGVQVINFNGFSDTLGRIDTTCSVASASCVPLVFTNFPVGLAYYDEGGNGRTVAVEFDDCERLLKQWCVEFPN